MLKTYSLGDSEGCRRQKNSQKLVPGYCWGTFSVKTDPKGGGGRRPPLPLGAAEGRPCIFTPKVLQKYSGDFVFYYFSACSIPQNLPGSIF